MGGRLLLAAPVTPVVHGEQKQGQPQAPSPPPLNETNNATSATNPYNQLSPGFNSSMAVTILILLAALFFMGFFSVYVRRFSEDSQEAARRRRRGAAAPGAGRPSSSQGLDPGIVRSLPTFPYKSVSAKDESLCAVCLGEFEGGETAKLLPLCGHFFHADCIDEWLSSRTSCPLCRSSVVPPSSPPKELQSEAGERGRAEMAVTEAAEASHENGVPVEGLVVVVVEAVGSLPAEGVSESGVRTCGSGCSLSHTLEVDESGPRRSCSV